MTRRDTVSRRKASSGLPRIAFRFTSTGRAGSTTRCVDGDISTRHDSNTLAKLSPLPPLAQATRIRSGWWSMSIHAGTIQIMSGDDVLKLDPGKLANAATKANAVLTGSALAPIALPPAVGATPVDTALLCLETETEVRRAGADKLDTTWMTKQAAALTEGPPELLRQDQTNAARTNAASTYTI